MFANDQIYRSSIYLVDYLFNISVANYWNSIHDDHAQDDFLSELISRSVRMLAYAS